LFPNIAVKAEDVTLGNPAGFSAPYFAHFAKLETGAALMPLFHKELNVTGITLDGATLNLEQNAAGVKNWEFTQEKVKQAAAKDAAESASAPASSPLSKFALGDVKISDSTVNYAVAGKPPVAVKDITLTISGADGASALKVDGSVNYQGQPVKLTVDIDSAAHFLNGDATETKFDVSLPAANIHFDGKASLKNTITANGALKLSIDNLPKLLSWATGKSAAQGGIQQVALDSTLALDGPASIALNPFKGSVNGAEANGKFLINTSGAVPSVSGALNLGALDLAAFSGGKAGGKSAGASSDASAGAADGWSDAPIDLSGLRAVNAELAIKADSVATGSVALGATAMDIALNGGALKLSLSKAALYEGNVSGVVSVNGGGTGAAIATDLTLTGVKIEPLVTAISGKSRLSGTANMTLNVSGSGSSEHAIIRSLNGKGDVKITDGAIKGANLAQFWREARKGFLFDSPSQETDFSELSASYTIANGILSNNDLALMSPALRVSGSGTANMPERTINYRIVPTITGTLKGQGGAKDAKGLDVPLLITGPWSNPQVLPDVKSMVTDAIKNPDALKQNLKDIGNTIKGLNSPKDIKRALFGGSSNTAQ
jgi:AsmA protein